MVNLSESYHLALLLSIGYYLSNARDYIHSENETQYILSIDGKNDLSSSLGFEVVESFANTNTTVNFSFLYNFLGINNDSRNFYSLRFGIDYYFP